MSKLNKSTISRRSEKLVALGIVKTAEIDTGYRFKLVALIPADLVFKWLIKDNPELTFELGFFIVKPVS